MRFLKAAALCVLLLAGAAYAEVREFDHFSADVPPGWSAEQQGATVVMKAVSSDVSLSIAVAQMGEATLEDIANKLYEQLGGVDFRLDEDGDFVFKYRDTAGVESVVYLMGIDDGTYIVCASSGSDKPGGEAIDHILDSLKFHEPEPDEDETNSEDEDWDDDDYEEDEDDDEEEDDGEGDDDDEEEDDGEGDDDDEEYNDDEQQR
jgi:hypothetical protein